MDDRDASKKSYHNRMKLFLIPVLGAGLLYAIWSSAADHSPSLQAKSTPTNPATGAKTNDHHGTTTRAEVSSAQVVVTWPAAQLDEVLSTNPFQLPEELKPYATAARTISTPSSNLKTLKKTEALKSMELQEAIKSHRLAAIVRTPKGVGAIVGDSVVAVGDIVGKRLRVTEIRPKGVVFELIESDSNDDSETNK